MVSPAAALDGPRGLSGHDAHNGGMGSASHIPLRWGTDEATAGRNGRWMAGAGVTRQEDGNGRCQSQAAPDM